MSFNFSPASAPNLGVNLNLTGGLPKPGIDGSARVSYAASPSATFFVEAGKGVPAPTYTGTDNQVVMGATFKFK